MKINPGYYYGYMDFRIWFFMHNKVFKILKQTDKDKIIGLLNAIIKSKK